MFDNDVPIPPNGAMKACTLCGVVKPLDAFCLQKGGRFGRHPRCRPCRSIQERERYIANRDEILGRQRASERKRRYHSEYKRLRKYGISQAQFEELARIQDQRCAICDERATPLCVDHDHRTGLVRGLLCASCNVGLGYLRDDPARLRRAATYVEVSQAAIVPG